MKSNYFSTTAIVLGGFAEWDTSNEKLVFTEAAARFLDAMELMETTDVKKLIVSGGDGSLFSEAQKVKEFALRIGLSDSTIIAENNSRNTHENAQFTSALFDQHFWPKKIVLVTSAFHMPRAIKCFEKQGFEVIPYATHTLRKTNSLTLADYLIPNPKILFNWNLLIKEWVGIFSYKIMGYI